MHPSPQRHCSEVYLLTTQFHLDSWVQQHSFACPGLEENQQHMRPLILSATYSARQGTSRPRTTWKHKNAHRIKKKRLQNNSFLEGIPSPRIKQNCTRTRSAFRCSSSSAAIASSRALSSAAALASAARWSDGNSTLAALAFIYAHKCVRISKILRTRQLTKDLQNRGVLCILVIIIIRLALTSSASNKSNLSNSDRDAEGNDNKAKRKEHNCKAFRCFRFWIVVAKPHSCQSCREEIP